MRDLDVFIIENYLFILVLLRSNASALEIENALNDIPYLQPNMVTVSEEYLYDLIRESMNETMNETLDGTTDTPMSSYMNVSTGRKISVIFSADLGDVNSLEVLGNISARFNEERVGISTGNKYQVTLDGMRSTRFDLRDSAMTVS